MANLQKYTRGAVANLFRHYERATHSDGSYYKFGNTDINTELTNQNYNLAPHHPEGQGEFIKRRCSYDNVFCLNHKNVNVMCSWVVSLPKTITSDDDTKKLFQETYYFLKNRYGWENVVSAFVHMDETTPHIHFAFVPITKNIGKKKGKKTDKEYTVSADAVISRKELNEFHPALATHLYHAFGRDVGVSTGITKQQGGNKTIAELKNEENQRLKNIKFHEKRFFNMAIDIFNGDFSSERVQTYMRELREKQKEKNPNYKFNTDIRNVMTALQRSTNSGMDKRLSALEDFLKARTDKDGRNLFDVFKADQKQKLLQLQKSSNQGLGGRR